MTAITVNPYTHRDLRRDLEHLQQLACDLAVADEKLTLFAKEMYGDYGIRDRLQGFPLLDAIEGATNGVLSDALDKRMGTDTSSLDPLVIAQGCQDAIDVLDLAIHRDHLDETS